MGKGRSAPAPPDPYKTAGAQTGTNVATAVANQHLANVNQKTPYGELNFNQTGTYQFTDPNSGKTYDLPTYTAEQTLSPHQQELMARNNQTEINMADLGRNQSSALMNRLNDPYSTDGAPAAFSATGLSTPSYTQATGGSNFMGSGPQQSLDDVGSVADAGQIQRGVNGVGDIQGGLGDAGRISGAFGDAGDITRSYGTDFAQGRNDVQEALMSRINPALERQRSDLNARLSAQGIAPGTAAYNREMDTLGRQENDARMQAVLGAGQEQSRLAGLAQNQAMFQNQAQQQGFNQLDRRNNVANQAQQQGFGQGLAGAQFANQAQQQGYNQGMGLSTLNNAAQAQQFGQNMQGQAQRFNQGLAGAQFANQAQGQAFGQQQQQYQNQLSADQINNSLQDRAFNADLTRGNAMDASRARYMQEQAALRNQPLNEISALLSGSQVQNPQFVNAQASQIPTTDIAGLISNNYQQQVAAANARQGSRDNMWGTLAGLGQAYITGGV